ncbi:MAG: Exosome non-catalytic core component [Vezdaea acicularis]|nr:MAG: Exosome non-catalytic core component [Vezdaea acicularis]
MVLDNSSYSLALLRSDGRRWNELRRIYAQISSQAAADGSSYLEMGNTKVICIVTGPAEGRRAQSTTGGQAEVRVEINIAGFSGVDRKKTGKGDKSVRTLPFLRPTDLINFRRTSEMQSTISNTFTSAILTHLYLHSSISIALHVLSQDGALLAACINATTLALIDAGIALTDYVVSCTAGSTSSHNSADENTDPLLDLNGLEEQDLPFLTVATLGAGEKVSMLIMETRVQLERLESMLAVGVDGCKQIREILDSVVKRHGKKMLSGAIR